MAEDQLPLKDFVKVALENSTNQTAETNKILSKSTEHSFLLQSDKFSCIAHEFDCVIDELTD